MAMTTIIFLIGMFLAALFAIFTYGYLGIPPSHEKNWVDYCFWGIMIISFMPLVTEGVQALLRALKHELMTLYHRLHLN
jgi:hypothetical protein